MFFIYIWSHEVCISLSIYRHSTRFFFFFYKSKFRVGLTFSQLHCDHTTLACDNPVGQKNRTADGRQPPRRFTIVVDGQTFGHNKCQKGCASIDIYIIHRQQAQTHTYTHNKARELGVYILCLIRDRLTLSACAREVRVHPRTTIPLIVHVMFA